MNFKNWYNETLASEHTPDKLYGVEHGWDACKSEILEILDSYQYMEIDSGSLAKIIEEVENL